MTIEEQNTFLAEEYAEAIRYMDNAKECLQKSKRDDAYHVYLDKKYVRMACGTAYSGVLIALDAWFVAKGLQEPTRLQHRNASAKKKKKPKSKPHMSINDYQHNLAQLDGKMLDILQSAYNILHLEGYYDGINHIDVIDAGFKCAYQIIDKIKPFNQD
jgi:hypothetical protein